MTRATALAGVAVALWGAAATAEPAPAPAMVGPSGDDADGYPLATADKRAALRLLRARRFDQLDAWIVDLQTQFEADYHKERWPIAALEAFHEPDPTLAPLLDAWVEAMPDSWAALAARGNYQAAIGWHRRGYKWASETPPQNFRRMAAAHRISFPDLDEALARNPNLVAAHITLIQVGMANSAPLKVMRALLDDALARCPDCFAVRAAFMWSLLPRWGGSYARMQAFADESARVSSNPKMRLLAGYLPLDRCHLAGEREPGGDPDACDAALAVGDHGAFRLARAYVLRDAGRTADALADLDRADELRPQDAEVLRFRVSLLKRLRAYGRVAADVAVLREIDPVEGLHSGDVAWAAQGLQYQAAVRRKAGHPGEELALLRRAVALEPDDLDAHLRLDAALSRARKLAEVVAMWNRYIAGHPDSARAHMERGGALHHLGREAQAREDARVACRLGEPRACPYAGR
jgi:tetratricopeptide (TPR) repeat protein